jgi:hypothetical protein
MEQQMSTLFVEYVGLKPQETDCVAGTKITWIGLGDVQEVPASAWDIMKNHPDVWKLVEKPATPSLADAVPKVPPADGVILSEGNAPDTDDGLDAMDAAQLRALADERGINQRLKNPDKLREALRAEKAEA